MDQVLTITIKKRKKKKREIKGISLHSNHTLQIKSSPLIYILFFKMIGRNYWQSSYNRKPNGTLREMMRIP